ncbi:MAG: acyltransferase [Mycolicibacterium rufum]|nr:acyltransferase [Mycolicibacterium rufum]
MAKWGRRGGAFDESVTRSTAFVQPPLAVPTEFSNRRLVGIQSLRGVAALMVVFHHVQDQSIGFRELANTSAGQAGVDLFFVISGFVMVYVTHQRERSSPQFLAMRAIRIIPVYWFYTIGAALLMAIAPRLFRSNELSLRHVLYSLLFLPHQSGEDSISPIVKQGWTLNYEVFFYSLFAIAIALSARRRVSITAGFLCLLVTVGFYLEFSGRTLGTADFYFNNIILEFAFGMLIGRAYLMGAFGKVHSMVGIALVLIGFAGLVLLDPFLTYSNRALTYGVPSALIVMGVLALESRYRTFRLPGLQLAGDASYSIYLVHGFPVAALRAVWGHLGLSMHGALNFTLFLFSSFVIVIFCGLISYYAVERTTLRFLRPRIERLFG